ncbi:MAG: PorT family protein [Gammaproteobacteria bacterium]|nr:PorT family protein [Gammaproteobacteria bacterium]
MKKLILLLAACGMFLSLSVQASDITPVLGFTSTETSYDPDPSGVDIAPNMSPVLGVLYSHPVKDTIKMKTGLMLNFARGYALIVPDVQDTKISYNELEIPIQLTYQMNLLTLDAGLFVGYGFGKVSTELSGFINNSSEQTWSEAQMNPVNYGMSLGAGYAFKLSSFKLYADAVYQLGLANRSADAATTVKQGSFILRIGMPLSF